jgi:putative ABC transport system substrate-binding protein
MRRRIIFLALCAMLFALCFSAQAQQPAKILRIGYLSSDSPSTIAVRIEAFRQGLRELGYVEGKTLLLSGDLRRVKLIGYVALRLNWSVSR